MTGPDPALDALYAAVYDPDTSAATTFDEEVAIEEATMRSFLAAVMDTTRGLSWDERAAFVGVQTRGRWRPSGEVLKRMVATHFV